MFNENLEHFNENTTQNTYMQTLMKVYRMIKFLFFKENIKL